MATVTNKQSVARLRNRSLVAPYLRVYWDNSGSAASRPAGAIPASAPTTADNGAGNPSGAYVYRIAYEDTSNDSETGGVEKTHTTSGAKKILLTFADTPPTGIANRVIYRSKAGETAPLYKIAKVAVATGTYDDNTADSSLTTGLGVYDDSRAPPPALSGVHRHGSRVFGFSGSVLYWCEDSDAEWWPAANALNISFNDGGLITSGDITGLTSSGDDLVIFKRGDTHLLGYTDDPLPPTASGNGWTQNAVYGRGCLNHYCHGTANGIVLAMDDNCIWAYYGNRDWAVISDGIADVLKQRNMALADWFTCAVIGNRIRWTVALLGDGATTAAPYCRYVIELDLTSLNSESGPRWWHSYYDHKWRHIAAYQFGAAQTAIDANYRCVVGIDHVGKCFALDHLTSDGVAQNLTAQGTVTSQTGTPPVVTVSGAAFTDTEFGSMDVTFLYATFVSTTGIINGPWRITAATATTFTLESGATAPTAGDTFYIGGIRTQWDTPVFTFGDPWTRKTVGYLDIAFRPSPVAFGVGVGISRDRRGFEYAALTANEGRWIFTAAANTVSALMGGDLTDGGSGIAPVPTGCEAFNVVQFRISSMAPNAPWQIYGLQGRDVMEA